MTDTPTPERGEAYDADDEHNLGDLGHQALYVALERAKDNKTGVMLSWQIANEILRGYAKAKQNRDALRAECARKDAKIAEMREQIREDRRDYAADSRMASAVIDVLRELMPNWESRFYDVPESTMAECAVDAIRSLNLNPGAPRDGE